MPTTPFSWAPDANYPSGPDAGTPTKVAPSSGEIASGFVRGTAAVAQHINWILGSQVQDWLTYLAGLSTDAEFLGVIDTHIAGHPWTFSQAMHLTNSLLIDGLLTINNNLQLNGSLFAVGATLSGSLSVAANIGATGNIATNGTLGTSNGNITAGGAGVLRQGIKTVTVQLPATGWSNLLNGGASAPYLPQSWVGAGTNGYGFHLYEASSNGGDRGSTAASLNSGNIQAATFEFTIPNGAILTGVDIGYQMNPGGGAHDLYMEFARIAGNTVGETLTTVDTKLVNSSAANHWAVAVGTQAAHTSDTKYVLSVMCSAGSTQANADTITNIRATYTTTHSDPNT